MSLEGAIRFFFASNAGLTIVILLLIIAFLLKEGLGFFPGYRRELEVYRIAGLEFVDISRANLTAHEQLVSLLNRAYQAEVNGRSARELRRMQEALALFNAWGERVAGTREVIADTLDAGAPPDAAILARLRQRFERARAEALESLPATPHLTATEREALVGELGRRGAEAEDDPALVVATAAAYAAARERHEVPLAGMRRVIDGFRGGGWGVGEAGDGDDRGGDGDQGGAGAGGHRGEGPADAAGGGRAGEGRGGAGAAAGRGRGGAGG